MANYKETTIMGESWQRCCQIVIENPPGQPPLVRFDEERILSLSAGGAEVRTPAGTLCVPFDPAREFALLDPVTGEPAGGTATYADVYGLLFSAYLDAARVRDAITDGVNHDAKQMEV